MATVVGIVGALLGGFLAKALFHVQTLHTFFNASTWVTAIIGAVVLFLLTRAASGSRRGRRVYRPANRGPVRLCQQTAPGRPHT